MYPAFFHENSPVTYPEKKLGSIILQAKKFQPFVLLIISSLERLSISLKL
jgi:hypothetical protein